MEIEHVPSKINFYYQVRNDIYQDNKTLLSLISSNQKSTIKDICIQLINHSEHNDIFLFLRSLSQLKTIHYLSIKHHQVISYAILNMLLKQKDNNPTIELFKYLCYHIKFLTRYNSESFIIDWKLFYYYYLFYKKQFHNNNIITRLYNMLPKFYENAYNENDYIFIKNKALEYFSSPNYRILYYEEGIKLLKYFVPRTYLRKNKQIQEILCDILISNNKLFDSICGIFKKIIYQHNKDYTSSNKSEFILVDKTKFVNTFFNAFSLYLSKEFSTIANKEKSNDIIENILKQTNEENEENDMKFKAKKYKSNIYAILSLLLFDNEFIEQRNLIDTLFERIVNEIHMKLINIKKGRKNILQHIHKTLHYIYSFIFCTKIYDNNTHSRNIIQKEYEKHNELYNRFDVIFNNYLQSYLLTEAKISDEETIENYALYYAILILRNNKSNYSSFLKELQILIKSFKENVDKCLFRYYRVYNIILIYYLSEHIYFSNENNSIRELLLNTFNDLIQEISSANPIANHKRFNIIKTYYIVFTNYKNKNSLQNKILNDTLEILENKAVELYNKLIPILDVFTNNISSFYSFVNAISMFISDENKKKISNKIYDFILNNEPDPKYFNHYFYIMYDSEKLFNTIIEDLVYVDKDNSFTKQIHCLYSEDIVKNIEITAHNQKKIAYYVGIFNNIDLLFKKEKCSFNILKYKDKILNVLYGIFNQKNIKVFDIGFALLSSVFKLLNGYQYNHTIVYPSNDIISFIIEIYNKIVLPYSQWIEKKSNEKEKLNEKILYIYTHIVQILCVRYNNIFLYLNENSNDLYKQVSSYMISNMNNIKSLISFLPTQEDISNIIIDICYQILNTYITDLYSTNDNDKSNIYHANKIIFNIQKTLLNDYSFKKENKSITLLNKDSNYFKCLSNQNDQIVITALTRFDSSTVELTKQFTENYKNSLHKENSSQFNMIVDQIKTIYSHKLTQIKGEIGSLIENLALDNITYNLFYLYKEQMSIVDFNNKSFAYMKIIKEYLTVIEAVNDKQYKDSKKLYKNFMDLILTIYKRHYNIKISNIKNKKIKHSSFISMPIALNFNTKTQKLLSKVNELYSQNQINSNIENLLQMINTYIFKFIQEYANQLNQINNLENDFRGFFIMTIFLMFYDSSKSEQIAQIETMICNRILNNDITPDIKIYWLHILYILLHKKHNNKKQFKSISFQSPKEYTEQYIHLIRTLPLNQIHVTEHPVTSITYYDDKEIQTSKDINIDINSIIKSLELIDEWSYEKYLTTKDNNIQMFSKFKFKDKNKMKEFIDKFSFFKGDIHLDILSTYINETLSHKSKFILRKNDPFKSFISLIIYYFFILGYVDENTFNVDEYISSCNGKSVSSIIHMLNIMGGYLLFIVKKKGDIMKCKEIIKKIYTMICMNNSIKIIDDIYKAFISFLVKRFTIYENEIIFVSDIINEKYLITINIQLLTHYQGYVRYMLYDNNNNKEQLLLHNKQLLKDIFNSTEKIIHYIDYIPDLILFYSLLSENKVYIQNKYRYEENDNFYLLFNDLITSNAFTSLNDANILELILSLLSTFTSFVHKPSLLCSYFIRSISHILDKEKNQEYVQKLEKEFTSITSTRNENMNYIDITSSFISTLKEGLNTNTSNDKSLLLSLINMYYQNNYLYEYPSSKEINNQRLFELLSQCLLTFKDNNVIIEGIEGFIMKILISMNDKETIEFVEKEMKSEKKERIALMSYCMLKYTLSFPKWIQDMIVKMNEMLKGEEMEKELKDIIKGVLKNVNGKYRESIYLLGDVVGEECKGVLEGMNKSKNYFM